MADDGMYTLVEWLDFGTQHGWKSPPPAALAWRLPVIRYVRWFFLNLSVARHARFWTHLGYYPSGYDAWILWGISRGWI
jgi:hypothetical protein